MNIIIRVAAGMRPSLRSVSDEWPGEVQQLVDLMRRCWDQDPKKRPCFPGSHLLTCPDWGVGWGGEGWAPERWWKPQATLRALQREACMARGRVWAQCWEGGSRGRHSGPGGAPCAPWEASRSPCCRRSWAWPCFCTDYGVLTCKCSRPREHMETCTSVSREHLRHHPALPS